jgi:hypothetical protein
MRKAPYYLVAALMVAPAAAHAGCVAGAAVGAVAGHYAGHHAVLGAAAGCIIAHHDAVKRRHEAEAAARAQQAAANPR